jgi:hypothetical protein
MQALRQFYTVEGNTVTLRLPEDFSATEIEVIILPSDGQSNGRLSEPIPETTIALNAAIEAWRNRNDAPPPLPTWTPEQRAEALKLSNDTTTMTDEEVAEWEKDIAIMRSIPSLGWENE